MSSSNWNRNAAIALLALTALVSAGAWLRADMAQAKKASAAPPSHSCCSVPGK